MKLDRTLLRALPKVLIHEHLDGVLRPSTVVELAQAIGYSELPTSDADALRQWFHQGANQGSLAKYLEGFTHTIAVMQTEEALERVVYNRPKTSARTASCILKRALLHRFTQAKG
jgi:adenosine deaminase